MKQSKLTKRQRQKIMLNLCEALCALRKPSEAADFLLDLLTPKETEMLAKRLKIAEYLVKGNDYQTIRSDLKVGYSTIARVNTWLNLSGKGYKTVISRKKPKSRIVSDKEKYDPYSWHNIKRRYSMYFWPQLLLEKLIQQSSKTQKQKISTILDKLKIKSEIFSKEANKKLYQSFAHNLK